MRAFVSGFTLMELVIVIAIIGILAAIAIPRIQQRLTYDTRAYADTVLTAMRYAQKAAIAQRRRVMVTTTASSVTLTYCTVAAGGDTCVSSTNGCANAMSKPGGGNYLVTAPSGVTLGTAATFYYNCLGRPMTSDTAAMATTTFNVIGDQTIPIVVEAETGYVH